MRTRNVKPVSGTVRWLQQWSGRWGRISITNQNGQVKEYDLASRTDEDGNLVGYGLATDDDTIYDIDARGKYWQCDCPDATYQNRECKHCKAVRAAMQKVEPANKPEPQPNRYEVVFDDP